MCKWTATGWVALAVCVVPAGPGAASGDRRPAQEILAEIDRVPLPSRLAKEARKDKKAVAEFLVRLDEAHQRREVLVRELWKGDPDNDRLPELLGEMWHYRIQQVTEKRNGSIRALSKAGADKKRLSEEAALPWFGSLGDEMDAVIAGTKNEKMKTDAVYWKAELAVEARLRSIAALPAIEEFIRVAPRDERGAKLLYEVARYSFDAEKQEALLTRLIDDYPNSSVVDGAERILAKLAGVGKPLELEFDDATTRKRIAMDNLRGKVVVVEVWATWCGPCVDEMPKMKALYERFRGQGVEFIGISLDRPKEEGGLDQLREFLAKNQIPWPQLYLNEGAEKVSPIIKGGMSVPRVFVVDQEGRLYSIHARGKLETILPELLQKGRDKVEPNE